MECRWTIFPPTSSIIKTKPPFGRTDVPDGRLMDGRDGAMGSETDGWTD